MTRPLAPQRRGFSLIEVLMVIAIAGILASIAIPAFSGFTRKAKIAERRIVLESVRRDVYTTFSQTGRWPWGDGPGGTNWNPPLPANGVFARASWVRSDPTWGNIAFTVDQPLYCRYLVHSGTPEYVMYVDVKCDLDADGDECTYSEGFSLIDGHQLNCDIASPDPECTQHIPMSGRTSGDNDCSY